MDESTLYDLLGLPRDASQEEIRHAYRQLVLRLHPDKNVKPGETELFIDLQQAYERLADPARKADYDKYLASEPGFTSPLVIGRSSWRSAVTRSVTISMSRTRATADSDGERMLKSEAVRRCGRWIVCRLWAEKACGRGALRSRPDS